MLLREKIHEKLRHSRVKGDRWLIFLFIWKALLQNLLFGSLITERGTVIASCFFERPSAKSNLN